MQKESTQIFNILFLKSIRMIKERQRKGNAFFCRNFNEHNKKMIANVALAKRIHVYFLIQI